MDRDTITSKKLYGFAENRPQFYLYQPDRQYYLGPRHNGWRLPAGLIQTADDPTSVDYFLLLEDLRRLQIDLGIEAVRQFIEELPYYQQSPEQHIFWSSHDDPRSPLPTALFCKTSVNRQEPGRFIAVPYPVDDFRQHSHFDLNRVIWQTSFVGYPGSSPLREQLLLAVAADQRLTSQLDIAPKFHSHLDQAVREKRRKRYLDIMQASLTVLCPRGDGMNSIRFYEALSMGRIPVLISDNCVLPFEELISYERFVIRIAEQDVCHAPRLTTDWINQKSAGDIMQRCREAREAWEQLLAPERIIYPLQQLVMRQHASVRNEPFHVATQQSKQELNADWYTATVCLQQALASYESGNTAAAEQLLRKGISAAPDDPELIRCLALLLNEAGRFSETLALLFHANTRQTIFPSLSRLLGEAYQQTGQWTEARQQFSLAHQQEPDNPRLLMNSGIVCSRLNRQDEALLYLEKAAVLEPASAQILMNLGCILQSLGRIHEATAVMRKAVQLEPDYGTAVWNLSQLLLLQGLFKEGWSLFEARFRKRDPVSLPQIAAPWNGEKLAGKTIVITTEQAFGDAIQFVRYLPLLARQGARVILYNHLQPLQQLFRSVPGITAVVEDPALVATADYQVPMLSLPCLFQTTEATIPNLLIPYLAPSSAKHAVWKDELKGIPGTKVGLCWAGRPEPDPRRSATLHDLAPLAALQETVFYSLQLSKEAAAASQPPPGMQLVDLTNEIHHFEDTAALICQLDLVISVDTSVAHLAGALGKPVYLLLPFAPDWRWMLGREDSPWYPTMRLFRQETPGDWSGPVSSVLKTLQHTGLQ